MIDNYRLKDLRKAGRLNEKEQKEESVEKNIEAQKKRRIITFSLMVLGIIIVVMAGFWYLQESRKLSGTLASDFSLTDLDGKTFRLSDFRGKVVVIDFMATWCGPCRQQMPHLKVIWENETYRDKIVLMSIDIYPESEETLRAFRQEFNATWIWARDTVKENVARSYEVIYIPTTVIIDQNGYIRFTHTGVTYASTLIEEIDQLLG